MIIAPIALFTYNRLEHTKDTINSLKNNFLADQSHLFIFSDNPKTSDDKSSIDEIRKYLTTVSGFKEITIITRAHNLGLAKSIKRGINHIFENHDRVIVLEDDIKTSKYFLKFMNEALDKYCDEEKVMEVSGYNYPIDSSSLKETYFSTMAACWGWGTWKRAWDKYTEDIEEIEKSITGKDRTLFKVAENYHYWDQLIANKHGYLNTWFIFWYASIFINNGLVLYSRISLANNMGLDGSGQNSRTSNKYFNPKLAKDINYFEEKIENSEEAHYAYKNYFDKISPGKFRKLASIAKKLLKI